MPIVHKHPVTLEGLKTVQEEYRDLIDVQRPKNVEDLQAARAQGDLSENADYDAARTRQAQIEARIAELEDIINNHVIIEVDSSKIGKKIFIGNIVTYHEIKTDEVMTVKIVGSIEADPLAEPIPKISNECSLGKALIDHTIGDRVTVETDEPYEIMIDNFQVEK